MTGPVHAGPGVAGAGLRRAVWLLLGVFLFALPLAEAPKNIAAALLLPVWLAHAILGRDWGGRWDRFDTAFALMAGSALLSAGVGGYAGDLAGALRVLGVAWLAKRCGLRAHERLGLVLATLAGTLAALAAGAVPFVRGTAAYLELPSVGHVNQSALYLAIMACAALGWAVQYGERGGIRAVASVGLAGLFAAVLLLTASRTALLAYAAFVLGLAGVVLVARHCGRRVLLAALACLVLLMAGVLALGRAHPELAGSKFQLDRWISVGSVEHRVQHWRLAASAWREQPWLGFGPESFRLITVERVCGWEMQRGQRCEAAAYSPASHAHSLYVSTLVERGILGVAALAALLLLWAASLARTRRYALRSPFWMASAGGFAVVAIGGLFNTTLRVEHGSLALVLLALSLRSRGPA